MSNEQNHNNSNKADKSGATDNSEASDKSDKSVAADKSKMSDELLQEILHKEIDLIEACITRMANNSFFLKGWAVAVLAVIFALNQEPSFLPGMLVFGMILLGVFWYLDAFYLRTERMFRKRYESVIKKRLNGKFDSLYELSPRAFSNEVDSHFRVMFSKTLWPFYLIPIFVCGLTLMYLYLPSICCFICRHAR